MRKRSLESLKNILRGLSKNIFVEKPCKIVNVHPSQNMVDVEYYDEYETDILYNVPVRHFQSGSAYIFLKLNAGDRGTIRFLDNDVSYYSKNFEGAGNDKRTHNINDGIFSLGFYPSTEQLTFSNDELVIRSGNATITINNGNISISGGNVNIQNINFLEHKHMAGNTQTSGVIT